MKISNRFLVLLPALASAFDYRLTGDGSISLTDSEVLKEGIQTIFSGEDTAVTVVDLGWEANSANGTDDTAVEWQLFVDGALVGSGTEDLTDVGRELPGSIDAGSFVLDHEVGNFVTVEVNVMLNGESWSFSDDYKAYRPGVSLFPLIIVILLAVSTRMASRTLCCCDF